MAPLSLACPLCCKETFSSHIALKYHLLSMVSNLLCPSCNEKCDDLMDMTDHLGRECKNLEKSNSRKELEKPTTSDEGKRPKAIEEPSDTPKDDTVSTRIKMEDVSSEQNESGNKIIDIDESGKVNENSGEEPTDESDFQLMYTCQMCNVSFDSVQEHLAKFHEGEEVLLETEEDENPDGQREELSVLEYHDGTDDDAEADIFDDEGNFVENSDDFANAPESRSDKGQTITELEMIDKTGMGYTRKVVRVGTDWINENQEQVLEPITTKYIVEEGKVRKITEEEASEIGDKSTIIEVHKCPNCELQFPNMSHFRKHKCKNAKLIVDKRKEKKAQLIKIKEELRYQCTFCLAIYSSLIGLNDHMKAHLIQDKTGMVQKKTITMTLHVCEVCNTKFPTYKQLRLHSRMHDPVKAKEVDPPVSYDIMGQSNDDHEEASNTDRETFQCHICEKIYDKDYEDVHMKFHDEQENIVCLVCNRKFDTRDNLDMHMKAHSNTKKFACSYCKKPFNNYPALEDHVLNQCQKRLYECQYCGRRFGRPHEKVKHERIHTGEKPHVCQVCGRAFRISYCLTLHMRTHTNTRPYSCQHCGKRFKSHSVFNHHVQTHSDVRKYKCVFCPKAFKTAVQLAGHKNSHTKPFTCTECNRPFASLYAVRAHMETHKRDNNLKFDCWICGARYARWFALKDHMSTAHGQTCLAEKEHDENVLVELEQATDETMEHEENEAEEHPQEDSEGNQITEEDNGAKVRILSGHEDDGNEEEEGHLQETENAEQIEETKMES